MNCKNCVFFEQGCGAIGTCEVIDTDVHEAQPACTAYQYFKSKNLKADLV